MLSVFCVPFPSRVWVMVLKMLDVLFVSAKMETVWLDFCILGNNNHIWWLLGSLNADYIFELKVLQTILVTFVEDWNVNIYEFTPNVWYEMITSNHKPSIILNNNSNNQIIPPRSHSCVISFLAYFPLTPFLSLYLFIPLSLSLSTSHLSLPTSVYPLRLLFCAGLLSLFSSLSLYPSVSPCSPCLYHLSLPLFPLLFTFLLLSLHLPLPAPPCTSLSPHLPLPAPPSLPRRELAGVALPLRSSC